MRARDAEKAGWACGLAGVKGCGGRWKHVLNGSKLDPCLLHLNDFFPPTKSKLIKKQRFFFGGGGRAVLLVKCGLESKMGGKVYKIQGILSQPLVHKTPPLGNI